MNTKPRLLFYLVSFVPFLCLLLVLLILLLRLVFPYSSPTFTSFFFPPLILFPIFHLVLLIYVYAPFIPHSLPPPYHSPSSSLLTYCSTLTYSYTSSFFFSLPCCFSLSLLPPSLCSSSSVHTYVLHLLASFQCGVKIVYVN